MRIKKLLSVISGIVMLLTILPVHTLANTETANSIIHQPTSAEAYVELLDVTDAEYQWYEVTGITFITDENAEGDRSLSYDYDYESIYSSVYGWIPDNGYYFSVDLKDGETVYLQFSDSPDALTAERYIPDSTVKAIFDAGYVLTFPRLSDTTFSFTATYESVYGFQDEDMWHPLALTAYMGDAVLTAAEGETKAALQNPETGKNYVCKVTSGETVLTSHIFKYDYAVTHHPSVTEPYVELNTDTDVTYQWYTQDRATEITDKNTRTDFNEYFHSPEGDITYDSVIGWKGDIGNYFIIELKAGDTVYLETSADVKAAGIYRKTGDYSYSYRPIFGYGRHWQYTAETDDFYGFYVSSDDDYEDISCRAFLLNSNSHISIEPLVGENEPELKNLVPGTAYKCIITTGDKTEITSNSFAYGYIITHQPTSEDPTVMLNDDTGAEYQWYTEKEKILSEITNENTDSEFSVNNMFEDFFGVSAGTTIDAGTYDADIGWTTENGAVFSLTVKDSAYIKFAVTGKVTAFNAGSWGSSMGVSYSSDTYNYYAEPGTHLFTITAEDYSQVSLRAYFYEYEYPAMENETGATLQNPEVGKWYNCEVIANDNSLLISKEFKYEYAITHMPTAEEPYIKLNDDDDGKVKYQWYSVSNEFTEITDNHTEFIDTGIFTPEIGWTASESSYFGMDISFVVELKENSTLKIDLSCADENVYYSLNVYSFDSGSVFDDYLNDSSYTVNITEGGYYNIVITKYNTDEPISAHIYADLLAYTPIDGADGTAYYPEQDGTYSCEAKYENGAVLKTTPIEIPAHTHSSKQNNCKGHLCECGIYYGEAGDHIWGEWSVTKPATYEEEGSEEKECSICKASETRIIPMLQYKEINIEDSEDVLNKDGYLIVLPGKTPGDLLKDVKGNINITDKDGKTVDTAAPAASGMTITLTDEDGNIIDSLTIVVPGDINGDGKASASDARTALRASVGLERLNEWQTAAANMDSPKLDKITAGDARFILRLSVGLEILIDWFKSLL